MKRVCGMLCCAALLLAGCAMNPVAQNPWAMAWGFHDSGHAARISSYDRSGGNNDAIRVEAGASATLADIKGPGIIRHIWCTTNATGPSGRSLVLRMYWDGSDVPSVESPIGDFFGVGNAMAANVQSWPISVGADGRALNCWWPMPFADGAVVTLTNEGPNAVTAFYYYIDYLALDGPPPTRERFHARYAQAYPADSTDNYTILRSRGRGHYVGCVYSVLSSEPKWWGEGDDVIVADDNPPLLGTGTEDYFCDAWGMRETHNLFHGSPVCEGYNAAGLRTSMYRFHILDPIPFKRRIDVTIEHGHANDRNDDFSSVAFWYQTPVAPVDDGAPFPSLIERLTGDDRTEYVQHRALALALSDAPAAEADLEALAKLARAPENLALIEGIIAYRQSRGEPTQERLDALDAHLESLDAFVETMPEDERYSAPRSGLPTDDDTPVPSQAVRCRDTLARLRHDLARRVALARGFQGGDEVIVEARDSQGFLTPPPAYIDTSDFINSYAKAGDARLLGSGARFTYGNADPSWARFTPDIPRDGLYEVFVIFSYGGNADDTRYEVRHAGGLDFVPLSQHGRPETSDRNNGVWQSLGTFRFAKGQDPEKGSVTLHTSPGTANPNPDFEYRAYADAARFVFRIE